MDVIGFGALNLDQFYHVTGMLPDGEYLMEPRGSFPGGSAANTTFALAKLGLSTGFIGAVGDDPDGRILLRDFETVGTDVSRIRVKAGVRSGAALCIINTDKRNIYVLPQANSRLTPDDIEIGYINRTRLLHLSSFADDSQFNLQKWVLQSIDPSVIVSFSPGSLYVARSLQNLLPFLRRTNILFLNKSELETLTDEADLTKAAAMILELGCQIVVVTFGKGRIRKIPESDGSLGSKRQLPLPLLAKDVNLTPLDEILSQQDQQKKTWTLSAYVRTRDSQFAIESKPAPVVDATGAGDAFAAGFLYAYLEGKSLDDCGNFGKLVASLCIQKVGCRTGLPSLGDLSAEEAP